MALECSLNITTNNAKQIRSSEKTFTVNWIIMKKKKGSQWSIFFHNSTHISTPGQRIKFVRK